MSDAKTYLFVTPSLKATGGNLELARLARTAAGAGAGAELVAMWAAPEPIACEAVPVSCLSRSPISALRVILELAVVWVRFRRRLRQSRPAAVILSHYVTYVLGLLVPADRRWYFVQDTEWTFVAKGPLRAVLRRFILSCLRRGRVLSANAYLTAEMKRLKVPVAGQASIWADPDFASTRDGERDIDLAVMLRRGAHKRADLVEALLEKAIAPRHGLRVVLITPDDEFAARWSNRGLAEILLRPTLAQMRGIYERTLVYALLSDHEGFGLPPLEAMGSGVVPLCRDAGGVRAYMVGELQGNVLALHSGPDEILERLMALKRDPELWRRQSVAARRIFHEGLIDADARRDELRVAGFI